MLLALFPLISSALVTPLGGGDLEFHHSYDLSTAVGGSGPRGKVDSGDINGDGLLDVVYLFRSQPGLAATASPVVLNGAYATHEVSELGTLAVDLVVDHGGSGGEDLLFTTDGDALHRWDSSGGTLTRVTISGSWDGHRIDSLAAAGEPEEDLHFFAVSYYDGVEDEYWIRPMVFLHGEFFAGPPAFEVESAVHELRVLDFDGDGARDEIAALHDTRVVIYNLEGGELDQEAALGADDVITVIDGYLAGAPDELALVADYENAPHLYVLRGGAPDGLITLPPQWLVNGIASARIGADDLADLVLTTEAGGKTWLLSQGSSQLPFDPDAAVPYTQSGTTGPVPALHDHDNDGDIDLVVVSKDSASVLLGTVCPGDEQKVTAYGFVLVPPSEEDGGGGSGRSFTPPAPQPEPSQAPPPVDEVITVEFIPDLPPIPLDGLVLAHRIYRQPFFDADLPCESVMVEPIGEIPAPGVPIQVDLPLFGAADSDPPNPTVFYIQLYLVGGAPVRALPISTYALSLNQGELEAVCAFVDIPGEDCKPKGDIGVIRIDYIPPPIGTLE